MSGRESQKEEERGRGIERKRKKNKPQQKQRHHLPHITEQDLQIAHGPRDIS